MENKRTKENIQELLNLLQDSVKGYRHLADHLENHELQTIMYRLSQQRKLFLEELEQDLRDMGVRMNPQGTYKGYFHRLWMEISSGISGDEDEVRIDEATTGEQKLHACYDKTLRENGLPDYINERMDEQRKMVYGAIHQLEEFGRIMA